MRHVQVRDQDCNRLRETFLALGFDVYLRHDVHSRDLYAYDLLQLARSKLWSPDGVSLFLNSDFLFLIFNVRSVSARLLASILFLPDGYSLRFFLEMFI